MSAVRVFLFGYTPLYWNYMKALMHFTLESSQMDVRFGILDEIN